MVDVMTLSFFFGVDYQPHPEDGIEESLREPSHGNPKAEGSSTRNLKIEQSQTRSLGTYEPQQGALDIEALTRSLKTYDL